jgi:adenosine deaminase
VVLKTADDFFTMTDAYLKRAALANVRRAEMFFDPQSHTANGIPIEAVLDGMTAAIDANKASVSGALIMCFLRHLGPDAAIETYNAVATRADAIIGVGLDSSEAGFPNRDFEAVFARAHADGLHAVAHAGEEGGPQNIIDSLDLLGAERIDHGVRAMEDAALVERLRDTRVPLTVCPLSNVRLKGVKTMQEHPLPSMLDAGLLVSVNSDDPAYFGGYVDDNYRAVQESLGLDVSELRLLARNSFDSCFAPSADIRRWKRDVDEFA